MATSGQSAAPYDTALSIIRGLPTPNVGICPAPDPLRLARVHACSARVLMVDPTAMCADALAANHLDEAAQENLRAGLQRYPACIHWCSEKAVL